MTRVVVHDTHDDTWGTMDEDEYALRQPGKYVRAGIVLHGERDLEAIKRVAGIHNDWNEPWLASRQGPLPDNVPYNPTESDEMNRLMDWVRAQEHLALRWIAHHEAGGYRRAVEAARLQRQGVPVGFPDYAIYWKSDMDGIEYIGIAIELKRADKSNHASPEQLAWLEHLADMGWYTLVCYGASEAIEAIAKYLGIDNV